MSQPSVEEAIGAQLLLTPNKLRAGVLWRWHSDPHVWAPLGLNGSEAGSGGVEGSWKLEPAAANVKGVVQVTARTANNIRRQSLLPSCSFL